MIIMMLTIATKYKKINCTKWLRNKRSPMVSMQSLKMTHNVKEFFICISGLSPTRNQMTLDSNMRHEIYNRKIE